MLSLLCLAMNNCTTFTLTRFTVLFITIHFSFRSFISVSSTFFNIHFSRSCFQAEEQAKRTPYQSTAGLFLCWKMGQRPIFNRRVHLPPVSKPRERPEVCSFVPRDDARTPRFHDRTPISFPIQFFHSDIEAENHFSKEKNLVKV